jgi:hypothetical protein
VKATRKTLATLLLGTVALFALAPAAQATPKAPAWELFAVTGPTHLAPQQSEVQRLTVEAQGGTFALTVPGIFEGKGTPVEQSGTLNVELGNPVAKIVAGTYEVGERVTGTGVPAETAITACSSNCATVGSTITLSNAPTSTSANRAVKIFTKQMNAVTGTFHVGDILSGTGIAAGTVVTEVGAGTLKASKATTSAYTSGQITLSAAEKTMAIPFNATTAEVQSALQALPGAEAEMFTVTQGPAGSAETPLLIAFGAARFTDGDVGTLIADGSALTGPAAYASVLTTLPGGPGTGSIAIYATNIGGAASTAPITVKLGPLPAGMVATGAGEGSFGWVCALPTGGGSEESCTRPAGVPALSAPFTVRVPVRVETLLPFSTTAPVKVEEGATEADSAQVPIVVSPLPAPPGFSAFWAGAYEANGEPSTQAGAHPYSAMSAIAFNTVRSGAGKVVPAADARDIEVDLPPGFAGNPLVTARCPQSQVNCGPEAAIGQFTAEPFSFAGGSREHFQIENDVPVFGAAAQFSTKAVAPVQNLVGGLRAEEDFGVKIISPNSATTFGKVYEVLAALEGEPTSASGAAFLRNPTDCMMQREESLQGRGPETRIRANSWQDTASFAQAADPLPLLTGCQALTDSWLGQGPDPKKPSFEFQPTTAQGSAPSGATARLDIPQGGLSEPGRLASSDLRDTTVTLPAGLTLNPASANGLDACTEAQIGFLGTGFPEPNPIRFNEQPVTCPDASKLGTVEVSSPLLEEELEGTVYLAAQDENPFASLIAIYLVIESPRFGVTVKLAGRVEPNEVTGRLSAAFTDNPQLPLEDLTLHFRGGGPRSELATPEVCGHYAATGTLSPWSAENGEAATIEEPGFTVSSGCAASAAAQPFAPSFEAGTVNPLAASYSPMVIKIARRDGEQELRNLEFTLPPGLTGKLAGTLYCPDAQIAAAARLTGKAELASPSCPAASQLGSVDAAGGVGPEPIHVGGKIYLAGPYEGAPLSSVVITPAVAGPFDLGVVVVRAPLFVNLETARITVKSDPLPTILKGIPLKLRSVAVSLDRPAFSLNPTSCEAMAFTAQLGGASGGAASAKSRFQVGGCQNLAFKPKLAISLKGATRRSGHPALRATLTMPAGGANIASAQVGLPHALFLDQGNLDKVCTQPELKSDTCPASSIYGKARAFTPLLDAPLEGPVYLGVGFGHSLPDLVADLNGQIRILVHGRVDTTKQDGLRNTFEVVPDAPVSKFVLEMKGGKKYGLIVNSENLCAKPRKAGARFTAQNGLVSKLNPVIKTSCSEKPSTRHRRHKLRG